MYGVAYIGLQMKNENILCEIRPYCCVTWTRYGHPWAVSYEVGIIFNFLTYKIKILPALGNHYKLSGMVFIKCPLPCLLQNYSQFLFSLSWDGGGVTTVKTKYGTHFQRVHHHIGIEIIAM